MKLKLIILILFPLLGWSVEESFSIDVPLDCDIHKDCPIQNYVDVHRDSHPDDPKDYTCGSLTYHDHKGIDFRVKTYKEMREKKVRVIASADGIVKAIRNDVKEFLPLDSPLIKGKECGNGVLIDHGNGWETQYCHMKEGSIVVKQGQKIAQGGVLGIIGMSGKTEFPHVHLSIRKDGKVVDPFIGVVDKTTKCGSKLKVLWSDSARTMVLPYVRTGLLGASFTNDFPTQEQIMEGNHVHDTLNSSIKKLVFWVYLYGVRKGDEEEITLIDPTNKVVFKKRMQSVKGNKATWLSFIGKKAQVIPSKETAESNAKAKIMLEQINSLFGSEAKAQERGFLIEGAYKGNYKLIRKDADGKD